MRVNFQAPGLLICVIFASVWSAPLQNQESEDVPAAPPALSENEHAPQIIEQEKELERLAAMAAKSHKPVGIEESHSMVYSNDNGKETSVQNAEKQVIDPTNDKLVADIKQTLKHPQDKIETKIDIPEEGVHETFVDPDLGEISRGEEELGEDTIEFTPPNVALYLAKTGAFDQFQEALEELVNNSMMTPQEAERYQNEVFDQYTRLMQDVDQDLQYPDLDPYYGYPYEMPEFPEKEFIPVDEDMLYPQYVMPEYGETYPGISNEEGRALVDEAIRRDQTLDMMIKNMIDDWLTRAVANEDVPLNQIMQSPPYEGNVPTQINEETGNSAEVSAQETEESEPHSDEVHEDQEVPPEEDDDEKSDDTALAKN